MKYKLLGHSGLRVSELCLGTMTFGEDWGWGASQEESRKIFDAFAEAGGNFIDTANGYTEGTSEKYVGECIAAGRERFVVATKYTLATRRGDVNASGNHRKNMVQALEASLKRLGTDYLDLYWVHAWDFMTPVEEVMRALDDLVRAGKVLYTGISDTPAWIVSQANTLADFKGWTPFIGLQVQYNLLERTPERDLVPMAQALDLGVLAWGPLGGGVLTGKYSQPSQPGEAAPPRRYGNAAGNTPLDERNLKIAATVQQIAKDLGCLPAHVALNWLRQHRGVIIPVIGTRSASQIKDNLACLEVTLTNEQVQQLDEVSKIELGFPHDFLLGQKESIYGGAFSLIENQRD